LFEACFHTIIDISIHPCHLACFVTRPFRAIIGWAWLLLLIIPLRREGGGEGGTE
jgi:hypothetical protein